MMTRNDTTESETQPPFPWPRPAVDCGPLGLRIRADGVWLYQGSPIGRLELVRLFAGVLWRDRDGTYYMTTPAEHGTVEVEDAPFLAVELTLDAPEAGRGQTLRLRTNLDDWVSLDDEHRLRVEHDPLSGAPAPYIHVRKGLEARLTRPVFYELVALALEGKGRHAPPPPPDDFPSDHLGIWSAGRFFPIGSLNEEHPSP